MKIKFIISSGGFLSMIFISMVGLLSFGYAFDGGNGSMGDPYQVASCADFAEINDHLNDYFVLTTDLDCSGSGNSIMIGNTTTSFGGEFNGNDHTITVAITSVGESYIGLFRRVNEATIENVIIHGSVDGGSYGTVGGLAGYVEGATILQNIAIVASITGTYQVAGLAGQIYSSAGSWNINNVTFEGNVYAGYGYAAGIAGYAYNGTIREAYASGTVHAALGFMSSAGGLVGSFSSGSVQYVGFRGTMTGDSEQVGGLLGNAYEATISDCYARGSVQGNYVVGGLIGNMGTSSLSRCYTEMQVTATYTESNYDGPVLGYASSPTYTGVFWNQDVYTGMTESIGTAINTEQMKDVETYTEAGWDIELVSNDFFGDGYPYLARQTNGEAAVWYIPGAPEVPTDLSVEIDDTGLSGNNVFAHTYEIVYTNSGTTTENIVVTLSGNINASQVTVLGETPAISSSEDGHYIQWTGLSLLTGETKYLTFVITYASLGSYPYTVLITSSEEYSEFNESNNEMDITSLVVERKGGQGSSVGSTRFVVGQLTTPTSVQNDNIEDNENDDEVTTEEDTQSTNETDGSSSTSSSSNDEESFDQPSDGTCAEEEYNAAYEFGFLHSLTTMASCQEADMDGLLLRKHAAKIMSNYAVNVLGKTPDINKTCEFDDMGEEDEEMNEYVRMACQLGIMGLQGDGLTPLDSFNPNGFVDKAQFGTILSRLLYGPLYDNNKECWYCDHMVVLEKAGIITVTTDLLDNFRRGYALLMLMRATVTQ